MIYTCQQCAKQYNHKSDYTKHINRKNPCTGISLIAPPIAPIAPIMIPLEITKSDTVNTTLKCPCCNVQFTRTSNLKRHLNDRCLIKNKPLDSILNDPKFQQLEEKNKQLESELNEIKELLKMNGKGFAKMINNTDKSMNNSNNTNTQTINSNNTQNNIVNINVFGKEDVSHITNDMYKQIFRRCKNSVPAYIKIKHFSSKKPENSNIYISDIKGHYAIMYSGEQWAIEDKQELLQNLYDINCDQLMNKYEDLKDELDEITVRKYNRFVETMDELETMTNAKEEIKKILYNEKDKSVTNRKAQKLIKKK
jgi:uncharacterized C2H2 Zn-finger protein